MPTVAELLGSDFRWSTQAAQPVTFGQLVEWLAQDVTDEERIAYERQQELAKARQRQAGSVMPNALASIEGAGIDVASILARPLDSETADYLSRTGGAIEQAAVERDPAGWGGFFRRNIRGVGRSLPGTVAGGVVGGPAGAIGQAVVNTANQAVTRGKDAGLGDSHLAAYVAAEAAIEGSIAAIFQKIGLGGAESVFSSKQIAATGLKDGLKRAGIRTIQEVPEELITEFGHNVANKVSTVDPKALDADSLANMIADTTAQTLMTMGSMESPNIAAAAIDQRAERKKLETRFTDPAFAAEFAQQNPEGAAKLAQVESPSRKQWDEITKFPARGTPETRKAFADNVRQAMATASQPDSQGPNGVQLVRTNQTPIDSPEIQLGDVQHVQTQAPDPATIPSEIKIEEPTGPVRTGQLEMQPPQLELPPKIKEASNEHLAKFIRSMGYSVPPKKGNKKKWRAELDEVAMQLFADQPALRAAFETPADRPPVQPTPLPQELPREVREEEGQGRQEVLEPLGVAVPAGGEDRPARRVTRAAIAKAFPGSKVTDISPTQEHKGGHQVELPNGHFVRVLWLPEIKVDAEQKRESMREAIGREPTQEELDRALVPGAFFVETADGQRMPGLGVIALAEGLADDDTLKHEVIHFARRSGLYSKAEWDALKEKYAPGKDDEQAEEAIAYSTEAWANPSIGAKIKAWLKKLLQALGVKLTARDVEVLSAMPEFWARKPERFTLDNKPAPAQPKGETFENNTGEQRKLLTGMDLLPGQQDLFEGMDSQKDEPKSTSALADTSAYPVVEYPVDKLSLSQDVPNFKEASNERGVVEGNELKGEYNRLGTGAIIVWERTNGRAEVITGRHRFDLARRTNQATIPAQVVREADGFTKEQAIILDAEANIRDGQGEVRDYAGYFRASPITEAEAQRNGLLSRAAGRQGFSLGRYAGDDLYYAWRNRAISTDKAAAIADAARDDTALQVAAIAQAKELSADELRGFVRLMKARAGERKASQGNLFGFDDSAVDEMRQLTKAANRIVSGKRDMLRAAVGAVNRPESAKKMGLSGVEAAQQKVQQLRIELDRWDKWTTDRELMDEVRQAAGLNPKGGKFQIRPADPKYANPGTTKPVRDLIDKIRNEKEPVDSPYTDEAVAAEVQRRLRNREAELKKLRALDPETARHSPVESEVQEELFNELARKALASGGSLKEIYDLRTKIDDMRSLTGATLRSYRDKVENPEERRERLLLGAIYNEPDDFKGRRKEAKRTGDKGELERLRNEYEARIKRLLDILKARGIDPSNLSDVAADPDQTATVLQEIKQADKRFSDMAYEFWLSSILSGIKTMVVNVANPAFAAVADMALYAPARATINNAARAAGFNVKSGDTFASIKQRASAILPALGYGMRHAMASWRTERPTLYEETGFRGHDPLDNVDLGAIPGSIGKWIRAMGLRWTMVLDQMSTAVLARMAVSDHAYRMAAEEEGLTGTELDNRMAELVNLTNSPAWQRAMDDASVLVGNQEGGKTAQKIKRGVLGMKHMVPGMRYITPFTNFAINNAERAWNNSPLGIIGLAAKWKEARATGNWSNFTGPMAQQMIAWGAFLAILSLASEDEPWITGAESEFDPASRDLARRLGRPPQSIRIGDRWYSYARIEPLASILSTMVDVSNALKSGDTERTLETPFKSLVGQVKNKTFLAGIGDLMRLMETSDGTAAKMGKFAANFASSWVPNMARQPLREATETYPNRQIWGATGADKLKMAGKRLVQKTEIGTYWYPDQPYVDLWGRDHARGTSPVYGTDVPYRILSPVESRAEKPLPQDLAIATWNRLHPQEEFTKELPPPYFIMDGKKQYLSPEQYTEYLRLAGGITSSILKRETITPDKPTKEQIAAIERAVDQGRERARENLKAAWFKRGTRMTEEALTGMWLDDEIDKRADVLSRAPPLRISERSKWQRERQEAIAWLRSHKVGAAQVMRSYAADLGKLKSRTYRSAKRQRLAAALRGLESPQPK